MYLPLTKSHVEVRELHYQLTCVRFYRSLTPLADGGPQFKSECHLDFFLLFTFFILPSNLARTTVKSHLLAAVSLECFQFRQNRSRHESPSHLYSARRKHLHLGLAHSRFRKTQKINVTNMHLKPVVWPSGKVHLFNSLVLETWVSMFLVGSMPVTFTSVL